MQWAKEFKDFVMRGNVIDMAVGIIVGTAFGRIINSLVEDILMPPIGYIMGGVNFSHFKIVIKGATSQAPEVAVNYGIFFNTVINFVIVAFAMFMLIRATRLLHRKQEAAASAKLSNQEALLTEIRDILKKQAK